MQQIVQQAQPKPSSPDQFSSRRLPWLRFFLRYPIFLLAFGPPLFRATDKYVGADTSQAHFDFWNIIQVGLLGVIAMCALLRLSMARSVRMTAPVRSVIKYAVFLGLLFAVSIAWSPGRTVSSEFAFIYFLILICFAEFIVEAYQRPPDWMQCIIAIRLVSLLLMLMVVLTLPVLPSLVLTFDNGMRLSGGSIGNVHLLCPFIAIVSAYSYLYSLEPRRRSVSWFFVGIIGTALTRTRGAEIALLLVLCILGFIWARRNRRTASFFATIPLFFSILAILIFATGNSGKLWQKFNRGQNLQLVLSMSGRTDTWAEVISYCTKHPQGMGYIAGLRASHFTAGSDDPVESRMGGTDNSYFETLADGGWLGLTLYLLILFKAFRLGWRHVRRRARYGHDRNGLDTEAICRHAISCSLLLLTFCMCDAIDGSEYAIPMLQPYYFQWITLAILMGAASTIILAKRRHRLERLRRPNPAANPVTNPLTNPPTNPLPGSLPRWS